MKKIKDTSKVQKKIDPEKVAKVLGAEKIKDSWLKRFLRSLKRN